MLVLRTCDKNLRSYSNFQWPESGPVEAPDWSPVAECGQGLHGFAWGEGDGSLARWEPDARWLVVEVNPDEGLIDLQGKVKFRRGVVVFCGDRFNATNWLAERAPGRAIIGGTASAGDFGTASAGTKGTASAGTKGTASAGNYGTASAGDYGTASAGDGGTASAGYKGTASAGDWGTASAGDGGTASAGIEGTASAGIEGTASAGIEGTASAGIEGTASAGDYGTASAGIRGTASAGIEGTLQLKWFDENANRYRIATFYVGENGIEPNVAYKVDDKGQAVRAETVVSD